MTYLDEAYRRFKLPIRVKADRGALSKDHGPVLLLYVNGKFDGGGYSAEGVKEMYLAAVKELSQ